MVRFSEILRIGASGRPRRRAMTLVEVALAVVLLGVGLFGVVEVFMHQSRHLTRAGREAQAQWLADSILAREQTRSFSALRAQIPLQEADYSACMLDDRFEWRVALSLEEAASPVRIGIAVRVRPATREVAGASGGRLSGGPVREAVGYAIEAAASEAPLPQAAGGTPSQGD